MISDKDIPSTDPEKVILQYSPLIHKLANRYQPVLDKTGSVDIDDLLQAGRIAIYNAQKDYDPEKGTSFLAFVYNQIRIAMRVTLGFRNGEAPEYLVYLDTPLSDDGDDTLLDFIPDPTPTAENNIIEQDIRNETAEAVHSAIDRLKSDKQREVIKRVWIDGKTIPEAAADMGMKTSAVSALDRSGRSHLRRDKQLRYEMPSFHVGIREFRSSWTSVVEKAVIWRDECMPQNHKK